MKQFKGKDDLVEFVRGQGVHNPERFCAVMPGRYFQMADPRDFRQHELFLERFYQYENRNCLLRYRGDTQQFIFHDFDIRTLREQIADATKADPGSVLLYRTFVNMGEGFVLHSICRDLRAGVGGSDLEPPVFDGVRDGFLDERGRNKRHLTCDWDPDERIFSIRCVNVAHKTMVWNLWETIDTHGLNVDCVEVWRLRNVSPKVTTFYDIRFHCVDQVADNEVMSLKADFERYIQQYTIPMSIFDMVGPAMVGPSSSHTAGANRIGQIARSIIMAMVKRGETIGALEIRLLGSFRDTGVGHRTPAALGGGLQGLATDDQSMLEHGDPAYLHENGFRFGEGPVTRFMGFTRGTAVDDLRYSHEKNNNIAEIRFSTATGGHTITGFSIGGGNVEVRYLDGLLDFPVTGKCDLYLEGDRIVEHQNAAGSLPVIRAIFDSPTPDTGYVMPFNTFEELVEHCQRTGESLIDVVLTVESSLQETPRVAIFRQMRQYWTTMSNSVSSGVASRQMSLLGLSGDSGYKLNQYVGSHPLFNNLFGRASAYATAVNELNAKSGVIVACPTAGSCGILPGVLQAYNEFVRPPDDRILESLMVAGFLGMLLFNDVSTAGADYGCQAEVGAAAAMAAAALCYLEGGDVEQVTAAFTLAIKNSLGLICDPIAGLVEIPCVKRNGLYSSLAISAALMALSGVKSFVSPDEVILTMREVGERLSSDYKETARGGLAKTRDGKCVERKFEGEVRKFFQAKD